MALVPSTSVGGGSSSTLANGTTTLGSGNLSTASAVFVDATGLAVTIVTGAHQVLVVVQVNLSNTVAGNGQYLDIAVDTVRQGGTNGLAEKDCGGNNFVETVSFSFVTAALTAASHTFQLKWRVSGGTSTLSAVTATLPASISAIELST